MLGSLLYLLTWGTIYLLTWVTLLSLLGSVYKIELQTKYNLLQEKEWTGDTVTDICIQKMIRM